MSPCIASPLRCVPPTGPLRPSPQDEASSSPPRCHQWVQPLQVLAPRGGGQTREGFLTGGWGQWQHQELTGKPLEATGKSLEVTSCGGKIGEGQWWGHERGHLPPGSFLGPIRALVTGSCHGTSVVQPSSVIASDRGTHDGPGGGGGGYLWGGGEAPGPSWNFGVNPWSFGAEVELPPAARTRSGAPSCEEKELISD